MPEPLAAAAEFVAKTQPTPPCPVDARRVLTTGLAVEAALVLGLVRPLWLFGPRDVVTMPEPLAARLGISAGGMLWFAATLVLWLAGYAAALWLSRGPLTAGARRLLVLFPLVFAVTLLLVLPVSSKDVYHYALEGRILAVHGDNPMVVPPAAYPEDRLAWALSSWQETPSRYGPVFNLLAGGVALAGRGNFAATVLGFKLLTLAALAGTATLVWLTARRLRPELTLPAFVLVAWNPLALYEAGANAHNDLLMVFFTALALWLAAQRRWALVLPALALGALVKYVIVLLGPVMVVAALRRGPAPHIAGGRARRPPPPSPAPVLGPGTGVGAAAHRLRVIALGLILALLLTAALYTPFWNGVHTFDALRSASGDMLNSPGWLLRQALKHRLGWEGTRSVVVALLTTIFLAGYARILWRAWRRGRGEAANGREWTRMKDGTDHPHIQPRSFAAAVLVPSFAVLLLYLCTVSWWLWPWYAVWLLPPAALLADRRVGVLAAVITGAALAAYVPINFRELFWGSAPTDAMPNTAAVVMFLPPLIVAGVMMARRKNRRDTKASRE